MNRRAWWLAGSVVGVMALAGAAYVAISLISTGSVGLGALQLPGVTTGAKGRGYEVIPATEVPQTQPDIVGEVVSLKDKSFMVVPQTKGSDNASGATTEVVVTADTQVYRDATKGGPGPIPLVDGKIQQRVAADDYGQIKVGDTLIAWGNARGDRLVAEVVMVEVHDSATATPTP